MSFKKGKWEEKEWNQLYFAAYRQLIQTIGDKRCYFLIENETLPELLSFYFEV